ncbi:hypothetical protein Bcep1808_5142 [Burkholderia vietnamiensis G4]|uniref:Tli3-like domain-containing protein n=3 Tax=Burkholderia vietnamiensis TaxID=60552 RepID=A4JP90_BURVG|nr:hypothetical protein Bcep1808_5142 [Burkholderia vietnamiensis G4]
MALARRGSGLMVMKYGEFHAGQGRVDALNRSAGKGGLMLGLLKNIPSGLDSLVMMARVCLIAAADVVSLGRGFISPIILVSFALAACANLEQRDVPVSSVDDFREYVVYRIDDSRYITIRSKHPCIGGQIDGQIFYYDADRNVRTMVSFTGGMNNGLYQGYYAINSAPQYVAIPSISFSEIRGVLLYINYSGDGGRTFNRLLLAEGGTSEYAIILNGSDLFFSGSLVNPEKEFDDIVYEDSYDIGQRGSDDVARYGEKKYSKKISRREIPFGLKSPSGEMHWKCSIEK